MCVDIFLLKKYSFGSYILISNNLFKLKLFVIIVFSLYFFFCVVLSTYTTTNDYNATF